VQFYDTNEIVGAIIIYGCSVVLLKQLYPTNCYVISRPAGRLSFTVVLASQYTNVVIAIHLC